MTTRRRDESGAVALLVALLCVVLFGCAAMAVDLTSQSNERQQLHDTLDTAALSGAMLLPDGVAAERHALEIVGDNDPEASPVVSFYCITGSTGKPPAVDSTFIPSACNPGPAPWTAARYSGLRCNGSICAIPCVPSAPQNDVCNAIELTDEKAVPFGFANIFGISEGSTGSLSTVACKGGCGKAAPNPLDIAVIADRTSSMSTSAFNAVKSGVQGMLQVMDPSMDQVMFGMNSRSDAVGPSCFTDPASSTTASGSKWFPVESSGSYLFNDYLSTTTPPTLNSNSPLVKGMRCMSQSSGLGTWLASPIDAGVELLTNDPKRNPLAKKAVIYMTDGEPNENHTKPRPTSDRNTANPAWGNTNGTSACNNALTAANDAKNADVLMVTIAYDVSGTRCNGGSGTLVTERLAAMAGPQPSADDGGDGPTGLPGGCSPSRPDAIASENGDGDFFFCAAQPSELASLFETAVVTLGSGSRLVWMP